MSRGRGRRQEAGGGGLGGAGAGAGAEAARVCSQRCLQVHSCGCFQPGARVFRRHR